VKGFVRSEVRGQDHYSTHTFVRSYVFEYASAVMVGEYILMAWRRGSLFCQISSR